MKDSLPIVFLGPSLSHEEAREIVSAEFREPIQRHDLELLEPPRTIAIIDGKFEQNRSISPFELTAAADAGHRIVGASSMGALRAAEVPYSVYGMGRVYESYASGLISDDDEVALTFDPDSGRATSEPMVNIRFAVSQLRERQHISNTLADKLLEHAKQLPYQDRVYPLITRLAGITDKDERGRLISMLKAHDLKRNDAVLVLEALATGDLHPELDKFYGARQREGASRSLQITLEDKTSDSSLVWETGDVLSNQEFLQWLAMTGLLPSCLEQMHFFEPEDVGPDDLRQDAGTEIFKAVGTAVGWRTEEEVRVTLKDWGLELSEVEDEISRSEAMRAQVAKWVGKQDDVFCSFLKNLLLRRGIQFKRELMRAGAARALAQFTASLPASDDARRVITRRFLQRFNRWSWEGVRADVASFGVGPEVLDELRERLAAARTFFLNTEPLAFDSSALEALIPSAIKDTGSHRFSMSLDEAMKRAEDLKDRVGISRIGNVEGLVAGNMEEIFVTQAYGKLWSWSTSITSGKSTTRAGAFVGAVMEMAEMWAYGHVQLGAEQLRKASYEQLCAENYPVVNPRDLALPYDSRWREATEIEWVRATSLGTGEPSWVPLAHFLGARNGRLNDPLYSKRLGRSVFSTNGGASGFCRAEAISHALFEYVERHNQHCWETLYQNPGLDGVVRPRQLNPHSLAGDARRAVSSVERMGGKLLLFDVTTDVPIPTLGACIVSSASPGETSHVYGSDASTCWGFATHLDLNVAATSAICEAMQTRAANAAGGREDLQLVERSLGRHDRPRLQSRQFMLYLLEPRCLMDADELPVTGVKLRDVREEVKESVRILADLGLEVLWLDLSCSQLDGVHVARIVIPKLNNGTNPVSCPPSVRRYFLADFLGPDEMYDVTQSGALPPARLPS